MTRLPPMYTRTHTLCPDTTLVRSALPARRGGAGEEALPGGPRALPQGRRAPPEFVVRAARALPDRRGVLPRRGLRQGRSEEHTSELQSLMSISYAVFG